MSTLASKRGVAQNKQKRERVEMLAAFGVSEKQIAREIGLAEDIFKATYRDELALGLTRANAKIAQALFEKAMAGDVSCMIFWMKTRARWSEKVEIDHSSTIRILTDKPMTNEEFEKQFCSGPPIEIPYMRG